MGHEEAGRTRRRGRAVREKIYSRKRKKPIAVREKNL
jgi:hypothetical protein